MKARLFVVPISRHSDEAANNTNRMMIESRHHCIRLITMDSSDDPDCRPTSKDMDGRQAMVIDIKLKMAVERM